jgi:hypothetical protein
VLLDTSTADPHTPQKRKPSGTSAPQDEHMRARDAPHAPQNRNPSGLSVPHAGHLIARHPTTT